MILLYLFFKKLFNLKKIIDNIIDKICFVSITINSNKFIKSQQRKMREKKERGRRMETQIGTKKKTIDYTSLLRTGSKKKPYFQLHDTLNRSRVRIASQSSTKCQIPVFLIMPGSAVVEEWLRRFGSVLRLWIPLRWAFFGIRFVVSWTVAWSTVARVINYR